MEKLKTPDAWDLRLFTIAYRANGDLEKALETVQRGKALDDNEASDFFEIELLGQMGRNCEARTRLEAILDVAPSKADALRMLAVLCRKKHDLKGMEAAYRRLFACDPASPSVHYDLGNIAYEKGDLDAAEKAYCEAADLDPLYRPARFGLALIAMDRGQDRICRNLLEDIVAAESINSGLGRKAAALLTSLEAKND